MAWLARKNWYIFESAAGRQKKKKYKINEKRGYAPHETE